MHSGFTPCSRPWWDEAGEATLPPVIRTGVQVYPVGRKGPGGWEVRSQAQMMAQVLVTTEAAWAGVGRYVTVQRVRTRPWRGMAAGRGGASGVETCKWPPGQKIRDGSDVCGLRAYVRGRLNEEVSLNLDLESWSRMWDLWVEMPGKQLEVWAHVRE